MIKQIENNILAIKLPEKVFGLRLSLMGYNIVYWDSNSEINKWKFRNEIKLPPGNWEVLGLLSDLDMNQKRVLSDALYASSYEPFQKITASEHVRLFINDYQLYTVNWLILILK